MSSTSRKIHFMMPNTKSPVSAYDLTQYTILANDGEGVASPEWLGCYPHCGRQTKGKEKEDRDRIQEVLAANKVAE